MVNAKVVEGIWKELKDDKVIILAKDGNEKKYQIGGLLKLDDNFIDDTIGKHVELVLRDNKISKIRIV